MKNFKTSIIDVDLWKPKKCLWMKSSGSDVNTMLLGDMELACLVSHSGSQICSDSLALRVRKRKKKNLHCKSSTWNGLLLFCCSLDKSLTLDGFLKGWCTSLLDGFEEVSKIAISLPWFCFVMVVCVRITALLSPCAWQLWDGAWCWGWISTVSYNSCTWIQRRRKFLDNVSS